MKKIHLDTDLGGDLDDLCALAMLLRWPEVDLSGITVVGDDQGRRTGYVRYVLELEGRPEIPVAAGADVSLGYYRQTLGLPDEQRYWPKPIPPSPNPLDEALRLLKESIEQGAAIVEIGPYTNLYLLDRRYPGILRQAEIFLMGGYVYPPRPGYPMWGNDMDFNIQVDVKSARHVLLQANPTLVPVTVTIETALRRAYLEDLRGAGNLGRLLARQAEAFAIDEMMEAQYGETCQGLPPDIIDFLHDPLACAIALGWDQGVVMEALPLVFDEEEGSLIERIAPGGKITRLVTAVDGAAFSEFWLKKITGG